MSNEPTPRTDAQINGRPFTQFAIMAGDSLRDALVKSEFARQLERELAEATKQRDALAEALRLATAYPLSESWYVQAIEALATLKPCD